MKVAKRPEQVPSIFAERCAQGDLESVLEMYDEGAVLTLRPGEQLTGEGIREAMVEHLALRPEVRTHVIDALVCGDVALLIVAWEMRGVDADGSPVEVASIATDVVRRGGDGAWRYVIDRPFGAQADGAP